LRLQQRDPLFGSLKFSTLVTRASQIIEVCKV
jgi:hypothetical protein